MRQTVKRFSPLKWSWVAILSFILVMLLPYLEGRCNDVWPSPPMLPSNLLPLLSLLVSCLVLFAGALRAFRDNRDSAVNCGMFVLSALLLATAIRLRPADRYHLGFTNYAQAVLTPDEWRLLSRVAQENLGPEGRLPGPGKNLWDERQHRSKWVALCAATQIKKLSPDLMVFVHPDSTAFAWGGALTGHRGLIVYRGRDPEAQRRGSRGLTFIAEDIAAFTSSD